MRSKFAELNDLPSIDSAACPFPTPGDFPLGSAASRAAARVTLQRRTSLTLFEEDCVLLSGCASLLTGEADPDYSWLERTAVYQRGFRLHERINGPIIPAHLEPDYANSTFASTVFNLMHDRLAGPGDILRYEDLLPVLGPAALGRDLRNCPVRGRDAFPSTLVLFAMKRGVFLFGNKVVPGGKPRFSIYASLGF
jgi:hypothetical protein